MFRLIRRLFLGLLIALLLIAAVGGWWWLRSPDPVYAIYETVYHDRFHRYDSLIEEAAGRHHIDPMIVKAVAWRESRFRPEKVGTEGERGLMQITDAAAREWACFWTQMHRLILRTRFFIRCAVATKSTA